MEWSFYPDAKKLGAQLKYAEGKGFQVALIAGSNELDAGTCQVKDLGSRSATEVAWSVDQPQPLIEAVQAILS